MAFSLHSSISQSSILNKKMTTFVSFSNHSIRKVIQRLENKSQKTSLPFLRACFTRCNGEGDQILEFLGLKLHLPSTFSQLELQILQFGDKHRTGKWGMWWLMKTCKREDFVLYLIRLEKYMENTSNISNFQYNNYCRFHLEQILH